MNFAQTVCICERSLHLEKAPCVEGHAIQKREGVVAQGHGVGEQAG
jgi:hypothetical protein